MTKTFFAAVALTSLTIQSVNAASPEWEWKRAFDAEENRYFRQAQANENTKGPPLEINSCATDRMPVTKASLIYLGFVVDIPDSFWDESKIVGVVTHLPDMWKLGWIAQGPDIVDGKEYPGSPVLMSGGDAGIYFDYNMDKYVLNSIIKSKRLSICPSKDNKPEQCLNYPTNKLDQAISYVCGGK